jgi:hypothetical protein
MKKLIPTILSGLLLSIVLTGCGDPLSQKVSELTGAQRNELTQQLTPDDLKVFLSYMKRQTTVNASSQESRDSVTIKQAILEEREWIAAEQQKRVVEEQKEIEKRKSADQAKLKENYQGKEITGFINNSLNYKLVDKANVEGQYSQPYVSFGLLFENKSEKDITFIDGILTVKDDLGRKIKDVAFVYDDENTPIEAKKSINYKARLKLNMREPSDIDLSTITFERIQSSILINEIRFKDKSKLKMPLQQ